MSNFGSAFDLSALNKKRQATAGDVVSGWLVEADENTLRAYLALSERVPVIMLVSDSSDASKRVRSALEQMIGASEGRFAGLDVSIETSPQLAQAVAVAQAPAALAILAGQPAPLFKGEAQPQQIAEILGQVLQAAQQNGITGRVSLGEVKAEKPLSPEHLAAFDAIDRGDLAGAKAIYEKLLVEYPNDKDAKAGLAQVGLMIRLAASPAASGSDLFFKADQLLVSGEAAAAFAVLLDEFAVNFDDRDAIKVRLLELFTLVGESEQVVLEARRRLASLLF
jgi:putative thioredoxin